MTPPMFTCAVLVATSTLLHAQVTAHLSISEGGTPIGVLSLELDHVNSPKATANFVGLASGQFSWLDQTNGVVRHNTPYYDGIKFHRVIQGFVSQVGSRNGMGTDGPGYQFEDGNEINNGLTHTGPYVVSMANSGPNTNGSQIFITAASANHLDGKHIVFGTVAENSRALADTINNVAVVDADGPDNIPGTGDDNHLPVTDVVITSVSIDYNGISFDPTAQGLPVVSSPPLSSVPLPESTDASFHQGSGSLAQVASSEDLSTWSFHEQRYLAPSDPAVNSYPLDPALLGGPKRFFVTSLVSYNHSPLAPSSLADRTFTATTAIDPAVPFEFIFDSSGVTGTWSYPREVDPLAGAITDSLFLPDGHGCRLILLLSNINFNRWDFRRIGFDSATPTELSGRHTGVATSLTSSLTLDGTFTLTQ